MKIQLTRKNISDLATNGKVFSQGKAYVENKWLEALSYDRNERILRSQLKDLQGQRFRCAFLFRTNGTLQKSTCSCEKSKQYFGLCEHQVASLYAVLDQDLTQFSGLMESKFEHQNNLAKRSATHNELSQEKESSALSHVLPREEQQGLASLLLSKASEEKHLPSDAHIVSPSSSQTEESLHAPHKRPSSTQDHLEKKENFLQSFLAAKNLYTTPTLPLQVHFSLELCLHFLPVSEKKENEQEYQCFLSLAFNKNNKSYPLKNWQELKNALHLGKTLSVHTNFEFYPLTHQCDKKSQGFFQWFLAQEIELTTEALLPLAPSVFLSFYEKIVQKNKHENSEPSLQLFFKTEQNKKTQNLDTSEAFPLCLIEQKTTEQGVHLFLDTQESIFSFQGTQKLLFQGTTLFFLPQEPAHFIWFFHKLLKAGKEGLAFEEKEYHFFLNHIYEELVNYHLLGSSLPLESFEEPSLPFEARLHLDMNGLGLNLELCFVYGEKEEHTWFPSPSLLAFLPQIPPLSLATSTQNDDFFLRELNEERSLVMYLAEQGFLSWHTLLQLSPALQTTNHATDENFKNKFFLVQKDQIFSFFKHALPLLKKHCSVSLSESAKQVQLRSLESDLSFLHYENQEHLQLFLHQPKKSLSFEKYKKLVEEVKKGLHFLKLGNKGFLDLQSPSSLQKLSRIEKLSLFENKKKQHTVQEWLKKDLSLDVKKWISEQIEKSKMHLEDELLCFSLPHFLLFDLETLVDLQKMEQSQDASHLYQMLQNPSYLAEKMQQNLQLSKEQEKLLRPYQKKGLLWFKMLAEFQFGGILADDMGLGKTLQALLFIQDLIQRYEKPVLVVVPTTLSYNWLSEAKRFVPSLECLLIEGKIPERIALYQKLKQSKGIVLISYNLLRQDIEQLKQLSFCACFLDEAQAIKNTSANITQTVKKIKALHRFALTGTPIENRLSELWSIFDFLMPGYLATRKDFKNLYEKSQLLNTEAQESMHRLRKKVNPFILRRLKSEVLKELPPKTETIVYCGMDKAQADLYYNFLNETFHLMKNEQNFLLQGKKRSSYHIELLAKIIRLRQICCHPLLLNKDYVGRSGKLETLKTLMKEAKTSGHRVLIFSTFSSALKIIAQSLEEEAYSFFYLDGQTKAEERQNLVNRFNQGEKDCFLISLKAGGSGLNLTGADTVILFDPWWNPAAENQAADRAHRIGQTKNVQVFKLVTKNSIEEKILLLQEKKKHLIDDVLSHNHASFEKLSVKELSELIQDTLLSFKKNNALLEEENNLD